MLREFLERGFLKVRLGVGGAFSLVFLIDFFELPLYGEPCSSLLKLLLLEFFIFCFNRLKLIVTGIREVKEVIIVFISASFNLVFSQIGWVVIQRRIHLTF